jgi:NAD(P)-dependent dehydrogenase (short-subunit alcohol dehydrogenase family)
VVGVDRNEAALKELPDGIRQAAGDPTDSAVARSLVDKIAAEVGSPEVLVNTIGTYPHPLVHERSAAPAGATGSSRWTYLPGADASTADA